MTAVDDATTNATSHMEQLRRSLDADEACKGSCNGGWRRRLTEYETAYTGYLADMELWQDGADMRPPEPPHKPGRPQYGEPTWCSTCTADLRRKLAELEDLAAIYTAAANGMRETALEGRFSGSHATPSPSPAVDAVDDLESWLRSWRHTHSGNDTWARQGDLATSVTTNVSWLLQRFDVMMARGFALDYGLEIDRWHRDLVRPTKAGVEVQRKAMRCPSCRMLTLEWRVGEHSVYCANRDCRRVLRLVEYEAMVEQATKQQAS